MAKTLKEIAAFIGGELSGDGNIAIEGFNGLQDAQKGEVSFIVGPQYEGLMESSRASAVIVPRSLKGPFGKPVIKVDNPSVAFSKLIKLLLPEKASHPRGIHATAIIAKTAELGKNVAVGPYVIIEDGASIGDNTVIYAFCYIGKKTRIGADCLFYPRVTVREEITVGKRVILHPGVVVGADGFGYDTKADGTHEKIPQLGTVIIEDDVEIGACSTVDRARFAKTVIGRGSKIDNLVQIAHNVTIGPNCVLAAQTGISGSCELGRNCMLGGQVGVADHIKLGDCVMISGQSGITKSFPDNTILFGTPARPIKKARDIVACMGLLPALFKRVRALEAKLGIKEKGNATKDY
jgi:UDP-3-O-[3-hydroxymyristoyl] glucosamine N-acyltransferase